MVNCRIRHIEGYVSDAMYSFVAWHWFPGSVNPRTRIPVISCSSARSGLFSKTKNGHFRRCHTKEKSTSVLHDWNLGELANPILMQYFWLSLRIVRICFFMKCQHCVVTACNMEISIGDKQTMAYKARSTNQMARAVCLAKVSYERIRNGHWCTKTKSHSTQEIFRIHHRTVTVLNIFMKPQVNTYI